MNRITGVTFIIVRDSGEMLMQLRDSNSKRFPDTWCFPGGTIEQGENETKTIAREIKEEYELNLNEKDCSELMVYDLSYGVSCKVFIYKLTDKKEAVMHEGTDMKWMNLDQIKKLPLGFEQEKIIFRLERLLRKQ